MEASALIDPLLGRRGGYKYFLYGKISEHLKEFRLVLDSILG